MHTEPRYDSPLNSPLLITSIAISLICFLLLVIQPFAYRLQLWNFNVVIGFMKLITLCSFFSLPLLAIVIQRCLQQQHISRLMVATTFIPVALIPFAIPISQGIKAMHYPFMHDVSTDTQNPPHFIQALRHRLPHHNSLKYDPKLAELQQQHYPKLTPLVSALTPEQAYALALTCIEKLEWQLSYQLSAAGHIEALDITPLFHFTDNIVIRIKPHTTGSQVDLRSVSQLGKTDLGANAARLKRFLQLFNKLASEPLAP